jgi:hypothetical protein
MEYNGTHEFLFDAEQKTHIPYDLRPQDFLTFNLVQALLLAEKPTTKQRPEHDLQCHEADICLFNDAQTLYRPMLRRLAIMNNKGE